MGTSLEERILNLEKMLGGRVSTEFDPAPSKESKIDPLATIYVCRTPHNNQRELYLTTKEVFNRKSWANIPWPYYIIVEYFGTQEDFSNVVKITVQEKELRSSHIYSPDLDELIYSDKIIEDNNGKHLLLKRYVNLTKIYKELTTIGINVEANDNQGIIKNSLK